MTEDNYLDDLVQSHWNYIEQLLKAHDTLEGDIKVIEFHYKSAFIHGWKHAMEYMEEQNLQIQRERNR